MPKEIGHLGHGLSGIGRATSFRESELKICDLCGWLNPESNDECFVCGWHGRFERDPHVVHAALDLALRQHTMIELEHLSELAVDHEPALRNIFGRLTAWVRTLLMRIRRRKVEDDLDSS